LATLADVVDIMAGNCNVNLAEWPAAGLQLGIVTIALWF